jgi:hypothetical protein
LTIPIVSTIDDSDRQEVSHESTTRPDGQAAKADGEESSSGASSRPRHASGSGWTRRCRTGRWRSSCGTRWRRTRPYQPSRPTTISIDLATPDRTNAFRNRPGVEIVESRRVVAKGDDFWQTWQRLWVPEPR